VTGVDGVFYGGQHKRQAGVCCVRTLGVVVLKRTLSTAGTALLCVSLAVVLSAGAVQAREASPFEVTARVAADAPEVTRELARQMRCKYPEEESLVGGGPNAGVECRVVSNRGRQTFYVLKYRNTARAIDFWRDWTQADEVGGEPRYIARKGQILVIPMGGGSGEDRDAYSKKWASYAVDKLDGRLVPGYPA
jgi:hypothetical protein